MSDQQPSTPTPRRSRVGLVLLFLLGIILLLPGLCSLGLAYEILTRGPPELIFGIWILGLLISALGVGLIVFVIRRARRS